MKKKFLIFVQTYIDQKTIMQKIYIKQRIWINAILTKI